MQCGRPTRRRNSDPAPQQQPPPTARGQRSVRRFRHREGPRRQAAADRQSARRCSQPVRGEPNGNPLARKDAPFSGRHGSTRSCGEIYARTPSPVSSLGSRFAVSGTQYPPTRASTHHMSRFRHRTSAGQSVPETVLHYAVRVRDTPRFPRFPESGGAIAPFGSGRIAL